MTRTLYLIVENKNDGDVLQFILSKMGFDIKVYSIQPAGGGKGLSRVAVQLSNLINLTRSRMKPGDCLAVLHDFDAEERHRNPTIYRSITDTCEKSKTIELVAVDKIEAWLLADSGVLKWLTPKGKSSPKSWDEDPKVKAELERLHHKAFKTHYNDLMRAKLVEHIVGDANARSPSLKTALKTLQNEDCL